jgi:hypothetical protein
LIVPVFYLKLDDGVEALRRLLRRGSTPRALAEEARPNRAA